MSFFLGSCPAPMAIGEPASGKSSSLRLIHALIGGTFLSQSSGESVASEPVKSTLPVCWDDPSHPNTLKNVLVSTFQGGGKQTKTGGNEVPRTTFLLTVNFKLDDDLRFVTLRATRHFISITSLHHAINLVLLPVLGDNRGLRCHSSVKHYA